MYIEIAKKKIYCSEYDCCTNFPGTAVFYKLPIKRTKIIAKYTECTNLAVDLFKKII